MRWNGSRFYVLLPQKLCMTNIRRKSVLKPLVLSTRMTSRWKTLVPRLARKCPKDSTRSKVRGFYGTPYESTVSSKDMWQTLEPAPNGRACLRSLSARANLAAETIFMDCVIFWMFLTDLRRMEMSFRVAIPRTCWLLQSQDRKQGRK